MLIDWFTVAAQAVNFLILVWLLKRLLYAPIIKAMEERKKQLADDLAHARTSREEANHRAEELSRKHEELEKMAGDMLTAARSDVEKQRELWLAAAKEDVAARSRAWMDALDREQESLSARLSARIAEQVIHLTDKILRDLADEKLEARVLDSFISRLADAEAHIKGEVVLRTGFPVATDTLQQLKERTRVYFPECTALETSPDETLGFGIVLINGDVKWEWNLASYLDAVEENVFAELDHAKART